MCGKVGTLHQLPTRPTIWIYEITTHSYPWHIPNPNGKDYLMPFEIHHIRDRGNGGGDGIKNLMLLCRSCHRALSSKRADYLRKVKKNMKAEE